MAAATHESNLMTNTAADPPVMNEVGKQGGRVRIVQDAFAVTEIMTDDVGDIIRLCRLPSNARLLSLEIANDDLDSNATETIAVNVGVYEVDGTVVDADAFASIPTQLEDASGFVDLLLEADATNLIDTGKELWERAGQSANGGGMLDICLTVAAVAATFAAGDLAFKIAYAVD